MSRAPAVANAVSPEGEEVVDDDGDDGIEEEEVDGAQSGERKPRKIADPIMPSESEVAEHMKTHLPFRNWCRHCVRGRGTEMPHQRVTGERELPEIHFDFAFLGDEGHPGETLPVLVVRERLSRMTMASAVPSKSTGTFIA